MGDVRIEQRGRVLVGTLDNPPHALLDASIIDGLDALVARAEADEAVGGVVLTAAHPARFIAHADVPELLAGARGAPPLSPGVARATLRAVGAVRQLPGGADALTRTPVASAAQLERFHEILLRMNRCGAVFVAALNGSALGGGCELALACDVRLMARDDAHRLGQPEVLLGFPPGGGGTQRLARLLGSGRALRHILDGMPLTPGEAAELGMVDEVVDADRLLDQAVELADRLGSRPRAAIAGSKRAVYEGGSLPLADGLRLERAEFIAALGTSESQDAMAAYVDQLERTGELPAYDEASRERALAEGRFKP